MKHALLNYDLSAALEGLRKKTFSATELTKAYLDQIERTKALNAYITPTPERALADAQRSDQRLANGTARPLEGIPLAVKDNFCTQSILTTAGSTILGNFTPPYESTVTQKLWDAGAILLGKTNMDEFGMGSTTDNATYGKTGNPWDKDCTAGGSSGGSAAAVACGAALGSVGSDTGGSVRQPAAFCGIVGVRPTYGRCSRWGLIAYASSLDQAGTLTRTVADGALMLNLISGHDPRDSTSARQDVPDFTAVCGTSVKGRRVGIPKEWFEEKQDPVILKQWQDGRRCLEEAGCEITFVSLPHISVALPVYYLLVCAEASSNLARYDGVKYGLRAPSPNLMDMYEKTRSQGFSNEVKRRILIGTYVLSQGYYDCYYTKAQTVRRLVIEEFNTIFKEVDILLTPTSPIPAFKWDQAPKDPVTMYWNDILTVPINIGGVCAASVPFGQSSQGMPLGLQIIAPAFQEERLFQFGHILEKGASFPPLPFLSQ